uniref:Uncharacterized protein n=1 Tax=Anopheles culicifacies TaxID=139723 RepID=A0A182MBH6_9DIPT
MMSRTRIIEQKPQNGGKHCPSLVQKRGCQGLKCHNHHDRKALRVSERESLGIVAVKRLSSGNCCSQTRKAFGRLAKLFRYTVESVLVLPLTVSPFRTRSSLLNVLFISFFNSLLLLMASAVA